MDVNVVQEGYLTHMADKTLTVDSTDRYCRDVFTNPGYLLNLAM